MTTSTLNTRLNTELERASFTYNARVNETNFKEITELKDLEILRNASRKDVIISLKQFEVSIMTNIYRKNNLVLVHIGSKAVYNLTDKSFRDLFAKLTYKKSISDLIQGTELRSNVIESLNKSRKYYRNYFTDVSQIKDTLFTVCKSLSVELVAKILNNNIQKSVKEDYQIRFQEVAGKKYVRAILDSKYRNFNNIDLLDSLTEFLGDKTGNWKVVRAYSDILGDNFEVKISKKLQDKNKDMVKGEPLEYSLILRNSETGLSSVSGSVGVYILKCTNGLVGLSESDKFELIHNRSNRSDFTNALERLFKNAESTWKELETKYNASKSIIISNAEELIRSVCKDYSLGQQVSSDILRTYKRELKTDNIPNLLHLSDSFSEISHRNYNINQKTFHDLEKIGTELLLNHESFLEKLKVSTSKN